MFELPESKRVRRADLDKEDDSSWTEGGIDVVDLELQARLNAQLAASLGVDIEEPATVAKQPDARTERLALTSREMPVGEHEAANTDNDLGEFEFRLFSTVAAPTKVILEDEAVPQGGGAFAHKRPLSYYLVQSVPESKRKEYWTAAVTGDDVVERSRWKSWGMDLPWKVTRITTTGKVKPGRTEGVDGAERGEEEARRRKRPGKKRRIAARMKTKAKKQRDEVTAKMAVDKEEHLKEKKKRLNRLKKLRKRAKKKADKGDGDGGEDDESGGDSGGE